VASALVHSTTRLSQQIAEEVGSWLDASHQQAIAGARAYDIKEVALAVVNLFEIGNDSPLEGAGFEPPVPREKASSFYAEIRGRAFRRRQPFCERAEASKLPPHRGFLSALNLGSYRQTSRWVCGAECGRRHTEPTAAQVCWRPLM
jgi:hypothetical protein